MAKWKLCVPVYDYACARTYYVGTAILYVNTISIHVPCLTQDKMRLSHYQRLVSRNISSSSLPCYCYTQPLWYRHRRCLFFYSGLRVTDLPPIQMLQVGKIKALQRLRSFRGCVILEMQNTPTVQFLYQAQVTPKS